MSSVLFRHEKTFSLKSGDNKKVIKESLIDGDKGLSFMLTVLEKGDFHRIFVKQTGDDKFSLMEKKNDKVEEKGINMSDVKKLVKANKHLAFVKEHMDKGKKALTLKGGDGTCSQSGGYKKASKKASKKTTKRKTKKTSKK